MAFNTIESKFEYQVKQILNAYRKDRTQATGDELAEEMWADKEIIGEIFLEKLFDYMDIEELELED